MSNLTKNGMRCFNEMAQSFLGCELLRQAWRAKLRCPDKNHHIFWGHTVTQCVRYWICHTISIVAVTDMLYIHINTCIYILWICDVSVWDWTVAGGPRKMSASFAAHWCFSYSNALEVDSSTAFVGLKQHVWNQVRRNRPNCSRFGQSEKTIQKLKACAVTLCSETFFVENKAPLQEYGFLSNLSFTTF